MTRETLLAACSSMLLLAACGGADGTAPADGADGNVAAAGPETANAAAPAAEPARAPGVAAGEPVPPPDAVSHPEGYLPPAPAPEAVQSEINAARSDSPATEDQYLRNGQSER